MTCWTGAQSPAMFGSPVERRSGRLIFGATMGTPDFLNAALWRLDVLPVAVHARSVRRQDRLQVTRSRIGTVRRSFDGDLLANRKQLLGPTRAPQHVHRPHLAAMVADLPVILGDVEIQPRVGIDQVDLGELGLELDRLAQVVFGSAVMRKGCRGLEKFGKTEYKEHDRPTHDRFLLNPNQYTRVCVQPIREVQRQDTGFAPEDRPPYSIDAGHRFGTLPAMV